MAKINKDLSDIKKYPLKSTEILVLRTCNPDMSSVYDSDFIWPDKGFVEALDWVKSKSCGNGLHGLPWGIGNHTYLNLNYNAKWLVVRVDNKDGYVEFENKCKYRRGYVIFAGDRLGAITILVKNGACNYGNVFGAVISAGNSCSAIVGYMGTAKAGDCGTAKAGDWGTAKAGDGGTATAGYGGTATAGYDGTAKAGDCGTATAGDRGTATAGDCGTATAGDCGTATAGDCGTAKAGDGGTSTAGEYGNAMAGNNGVIIIYWYNKKLDRLIPVIGVIGENGLKPNVKYRLNNKHKFEEVVESEVKNNA